MDENGTRKNEDNNISVSKPVFALLVLALCGTVCYSAYNAGYMRGLEKGQQTTAAAAAPEPAEAPSAGAPQNGGQADVPAGNGGAGSNPFNGSIFRDLNPFNAGPGENAPGTGSTEGGVEGGEKPDENSKPPEQGAVLNIVGATVTDEARQTYNIPAGVLVMDVTEDGAAEKAGIKAHSVITAVDGKTVSTIDELKGLLAERHPGDTVSVTLYEPSDDHGFTEKTIDVTLNAK